jgi:WD40 repeat protein
VQFLPGRLKGLSDVVFSADGRFVAACGASGLVAWDLTRPEARPVQYATRGTAFLQTLPGVGLLATPPEGLFVYDPAAGTARSLGLRGGYTGRIFFPRASPDGGQVVVCGWSSKLRLYDLAEGKATLRWALPLRARDYPRAEFLPPGDRLLVLERDNRRHTWPQWLVARDAASGEKLGEWSIGERPKLPDHFVLSPDGRILVMGAGAALEAWDAADPGRPPRRVGAGRRHQVLGAAFHPSGAVLAAVGNNSVVRLWDPRSWAEMGAFAWNLGKLRAVAFSPDGNLAAVGAVNGRVLVWDVDL